jgi:hypothetical protein
METNSRINSKPHSASNWRLLAACLLPFVVSSAYLYLSRLQTSWETTAGDYAGLIISIAAGLSFVVTLPGRLKLRWVLAVVYFLVFGVVLLFYGVWFVCAVFKDCL